MLKILSCYRVCIVISSTFFIFGFFTAANLLGLSQREVVIGLVAGAIGGITTLCVTAAG